MCGYRGVFVVCIINSAQNTEKEATIMFDELLKLDLSTVDRHPKPSFVVFPDGRTVQTDDGSHAMTVIQTSRKYYPELAKIFEPMIQEEISLWCDDEEMTEEEKDRVAGMIVLNGEYLMRRGLVLIHNCSLIFCEVRDVTKEQIQALDRINEVCPIERLDEFKRWNGVIG